MYEIAIATHHTSELLEITKKVQGVLDKTSPHTTAGLLINERADPAVAHDILAFLEEFVPRNRPWTHAEGNSPAHVKTALLGNSLQIAFEQGKLLLGRWQGIFFCEFDGPRNREIWLWIVS